MNVTPEIIDAVGKAVIGIVAAFGALIGPVVAFYTWKTRYELDKLYAATYRPNADGSPGPMRRHPVSITRMFQTTKTLPTPNPSADAEVPPKDLET